MSEFVAEISDGAPHVLVVSGELDIAATDEFLAQCRKALAEPSAVLEIDIGGVTFIDSTGMGALVRIRHEATEAGTQVQLTQVPRQVSRVLDLTGLTELFSDEKDA